MSGNSGGVLGPGPDGLLYICIWGDALEECPRGLRFWNRLGGVIPESADTEFQVVPLPDRLVSAVATGRLELIPFKRESGFVVAPLLCNFPLCGDGRYINI